MPRVAFVLVAGLSVALAATSAEAGIVRLGEIVNGVSGDGKAAAYYQTEGDNLGAYRWTTSGGSQFVRKGSASDISRDGTTVTGQGDVNGQQRAFRWTESQGAIDLGQLPGTGPAGTAFTAASDTNGDGSVVVGLATASNGFRGFRWTQATGMTQLNALFGQTFSWARAISGNGQVTVGSSGSGNSARAVRWIGNSITATSLGVPIGRSGFTDGTGVSGDGKVVVGVWGDGQQNEAFRWTESGGFEMLGDVPGGPLDSVALGTNWDGSVVVGTGNPGLNLPDVATYWTKDAGLQTLWDVLLGAGVDLSGWRSLDYPTDVSDDGKTVVGQGTLSDGTLAGFLVVIPAPGTATFAFAGLLMVARRRR